MDYDNMTRDELIATIERLSYSKWSGLKTAERGAIDLEQVTNWHKVSLIYGDVDGLKLLNDQHGKISSSLMLRNAFRSYCNLLSLNFSGDEVVAVMPDADALGFCHRLQNEFYDAGMSITLAIRYGNIHYRHIIDELDEAINRIKKEGGRGSITDLRFS